jgi:hypothetical protein
VHEICGKQNSPEWAMTAYIHPHMIARDELPDSRKLAADHKEH